MRITEVVEKFVLSRCTWARLIAQVHEVDPLTCCRCGSLMQILAVITEPDEVRKLLHYLVKIGLGRPAARLLASIQLR